MYSSCLCRHIYNNFLFHVFSKISALVSYAKIREEIKFMYVCMFSLCCSVLLDFQSFTKKPVFEFVFECAFAHPMDIKSFYTVIPNNDGLQALKYHLNLRPLQQPPTDTLVRLAELVLKLN